MKLAELHAKLTEIIERRPELGKSFVNLYEDAENEGLEIEVPESRASESNIIITF
jgi:hypothetical protein